MRPWSIQAVGDKLRQKKGVEPVKGVGPVKDVGPVLGSATLQGVGRTSYCLGMLACRH